ncbi:uncharacterized protein IL334_003846 [Kwoniella shivajii]|uniref:Uncharacterized protein n=1 Tax=Kwoniella shivajii TaxID=564305 RepID=A0ABZ1CZA4_9TREE|nr:hypothetical protein IL334_003846 [Kwoniella shivajii]
MSSNNTTLSGAIVKRGRQPTRNSHASAARIAGNLERYEAYLPRTTTDCGEWGRLPGTSSATHSILPNPSALSGPTDNSQDVDMDRPETEDNDSVDREGSVNSDDADKEHASVAGEDGSQSERSCIVSESESGEVENDETEQKIIGKNIWRQKEEMIPEGNEKSGDLSKWLDGLSITD